MRSAHKSARFFEHEGQRALVLQDNGLARKWDDAFGLRRTLSLDALQSKKAEMRVPTTDESLHEIADARVKWSVVLQESLIPDEEKILERIFDDLQPSSVRRESRFAEPSGARWVRAEISRRCACRSPCSRRALTKGPSTEAPQGPAGRVVGAGFHRSLLFWRQCRRFE